MPLEGRRCPVLLHGRSKKYNFEIQLCTALAFFMQSSDNLHKTRLTLGFPHWQTVHFNLQHRGAAPGTFPKCIHQGAFTKCLKALRATRAIAASPLKSAQRCCCCCCCLCSRCAQHHHGQGTFTFHCSQPVYCMQEKPEAKRCKVPLLPCQKHFALSRARGTARLKCGEGLVSRGKHCQAL